MRTERAVAAAILGLALACAGSLAPRALKAAEPNPAAHSAGAASGSPFADFSLPDAWEARFWADPNVKALRAKDLSAIAKLVPQQAGLRHCRCPACDAAEAADPLEWSLANPDVLTCRNCGVAVPNSDYPAKVEKKLPAEEVEVLPGVIHHYPYHTVPPEQQRYPDERLYLAAKRDYEVREWLAKVALYAAVRYHEQPAQAKDTALARLACVLLLRFAQVYPAYSVHFDQPGQAKFFERADQPPPYRRGYHSGKWDWLGCLDVPLNLVVVYAFLRDEPAMAEAGRLLHDPQPRLTIERGLFRAAAEFVRRQPDEYEELSLYAYRGLLAVGRLLDDQALTRDAALRFAAFTEGGFYHDGLWSRGEGPGQRRVLSLLDGWFDRLLPGAQASRPMLDLARAAAGSVLEDQHGPDVQQAAWPPAVPLQVVRQPMLLGGAGVARLAVGQGPDALDLELRGVGDLGSPHYNRLAIRLAVGGQPVLGDLDDLPPSPSGWERSTASHNAVLVDGLNQRETPVRARHAAPGSDILFFAADPDLQVATLEDRYAYALSSTRYRHTIVVSAGARARYAVSVFEVRGGLQHDQLFQGAPGMRGEFRTVVELKPGPPSLLPVTVSYLPHAKAADGRWFVQAYGAFSRLAHTRVEHATQIWLSGVNGDPGRAGVRLHLLNDEPRTLHTGLAPDPSAAADSNARPDVPANTESGRPMLLVRRRSEDGSSLATTFVTLLEPLGAAPALRSVTRVPSPPETVVLRVETEEGPEHLVINLRPGTLQTVQLATGQPLTTDGLVARVRPTGLVLAGGTVVEAGTLALRQSRAAGRLVASSREASPGSRGWFEADAPVADPQTLTGRALLIRHNDGTTRGWTIASVENAPTGRARFHVREEPGFVIGPGNPEAHYYQFPKTSAPGPHRYRVAKVSRTQ